MTEHEAAIEADIELEERSTSTFAEDVAACWNPVFQRPQMEWPDVPRCDKPRVIKSKGGTK